MVLKQNRCSGYFYTLILNTHTHTQRSDHQQIHRKQMHIRSYFQKVLQMDYVPALGKCMHHTHATCISQIRTNTHTMNTCPILAFMYVHIITAIIPTVHRRWHFNYIKVSWGVLALECASVCVYACMRTRTFRRSATLNRTVLCLSAQLCVFTYALDVALSLHTWALCP